ncbi:hypothetical protein ACVXG7_03500 [Enterobacter hormaechei]
MRSVPAITFRLKLYPDRQTARALGNAGPVSDFMLDIEEAGCALRWAPGAHACAVRCDPRFTGRADGESAGRQPAGGKCICASRRSAWRWRRRYAGWACSGSEFSRYPENAECDEAWQQFCQRTADAPLNPFLSLS